MEFRFGLHMGMMMVEQRLHTAPRSSANSASLLPSFLCTLIGPKTNNVEMLTKLREAGMNIARMVSITADNGALWSADWGRAKAWEVYPLALLKLDM